MTTRLAGGNGFTGWPARPLRNATWAAAGAEIQAALARVVIGGLLASTLVTLLLIPVTYTTATGALARLRARNWSWRAWRARGDGRPEAEEDRAATA